MTCTRPQSTHIFLASALALTAFAAAPALSDPGPAAAPKDLPDPLHPCTVLLCLPGPGKAAEAATPAPVPVPYPNTAPRDAASGLATGKRMHKPYTAQATTCTATGVQPANVASDPEEGGQASRTATTGWDVKKNAKTGLVDSSDPEEGGQVARTARTKPTVSEMTVTKKTDTASPKLAGSAPSGSAPCEPGQH